MRMVLIALLILWSSVGECTEFGAVSLGGFTSESQEIELNLMPLGDSITYGNTGGDADGYRFNLQALLGVGVYDFVGSIQQPASDETYDVDGSGVGGNTSSQIEARTDGELDTYMSTTSDGGIVLLHGGTNDILLELSEAAAVQNIIDIIDLIDAHNSNIDIYVALIIPRKDNDGWADSYNTALNTALETKQGSKTNLVIVDMNTAFTADTFGNCSGDWEANCIDPEDITKLHPNGAGYATMAKQWNSCMSSSTNTNCNGN